MKAKDLKALIATIPDEDEVGWAEYTDYAKCFGLDTNFYTPTQYQNSFNKEQKVWVFNADMRTDVLAGYEKVSEVDEELEKILTSFPPNPLWKIEKIDEKTLAVLFNNRFFNLCFYVEKTETSPKQYFYTIPNGNPHNFTNWVEFFQTVDPIIKKRIDSLCVEVISLKKQVTPE